MDIRPASSEDLQDLLPLWREMMAEHSCLDEIYRLRPDAEASALDHFRRICSAEDRLLLVCRGEAVHGYLSASIRPAPPVFAADPVGVINELAVAARFRRRSIGRQLYEQARIWLQSRGIRRVEVRTLTQNEQSNGFWIKLGFEPYAAEYKASTGGS